MPTRSRSWSPTTRATTCSSLSAAAMPGNASRALAHPRRLEKRRRREPPFIIWALVNDLRGSRGCCRPNRTLATIDGIFRAEQVWAQPARADPGRAAAAGRGPTSMSLLRRRRARGSGRERQPARRTLGRDHRPGRTHCRREARGRMTARFPSAPSVSSAARSTRSTSATCAPRSSCCRRVALRRSALRACR